MSWKELEDRSGCASVPWPGGCVEQGGTGGDGRGDTVDACGEDEQAMGFRAVIVDNFKMPFVTSVSGVDVTVEDIDLADDNILAICARGGTRQAARVVDLPLPEPLPATAERIEAYRCWLG